MAKNQEVSSQHTVNVGYSPKFAKKLARYSGLAPMDAAIEIIENGREAIAGDKGRLTVVIAPPENQNLPKGLNAYFLDNGCGMNLSDIEKMFIYGESSNKLNESVNAGFGAKSGEQLLMDKHPDSYVKIFTKKNSFPTYCVIWDGSAKVVVNEVEDIPEIGEHGTMVALYGTALTEEEAEAVKKHLRVRYCTPIKKGLEIKVNGEVLSPEYPLHNEFEDPEGFNTWDRFTTTVLGPIDGEEYNIAVDIRNVGAFINPETNTPVDGFNLNNWDSGEKDECRIKSFQLSGFYYNVGGVILHPGGWDGGLISRQLHQQMNGIFVEIKFPIKLAAQLQYHFNKTKGFTNLGKEPSLSPLRNDIKLHIEKMVQSCVSSSQKRHEEEVLAYKNVRTTSYGEKIRFSVNTNLTMPKKTFAFYDEATRSFIFNPRSPFFSCASKNAKQFKALAHIAESMIITMFDSLYETGKFQPSYGSASTHPRTAAVAARNQTVEMVSSTFLDNLMSLPE